MTARIVISCDYPDTSTGRCRAFLTTRWTDEHTARQQAADNSWTTADDGTDRCPGHSGDGGER